MFDYQRVKIRISKNSQTLSFRMLLSGMNEPTSVSLGLFRFSNIQKNSKMMQNVIIEMVQIREMDFSGILSHMLHQNNV